MATGTDSRRETANDDVPRTPLWSTWLVAVLGVVALLLVGGTGGLLIGMAGSRTPSTPPADSVDVGFSQDMSVHHQQGVEMASWARDHTSDPTLKIIATDIETTQGAQIGRMQGWLELWDAAALPSGGHMAWMASAPGHDHTGADPATGRIATMPGMATADELRTLRATTGPQLDVTFLQLMLRHHQGGAEMLAYASRNATAPAVRNLATQMLSAQSAESQNLLAMLTARGGTPLPR